MEVFPYGKFTMIPVKVTPHGDGRVTLEVEYSAAEGQPSMVEVTIPDGKSE